ncbi:MAG: hypothetical protein AAF581_01440, partial [Planctomycetota bacterium]
MMSLAGKARMFHVEQWVARLLVWEGQEKKGSAAQPGRRWRAKGARGQGARGKGKGKGKREKGKGKREKGKGK